MNSYIVRIYRRDPATQEIVGLVELPESHERIRFQSFAHLRAILSSPFLDNAIGDFQIGNTDRNGIDPANGD
jgi:hypothetical protein